MKRLLFASVLALLLSLGAAAQTPRGHLTYGVGQTYQPVVDHSLDQLVAAREKLINRYVLGNPRMAWGVSVSGADDIFTGDESSWLTVYLYKDSLLAFAADFDKYATKSKNGTLQVDGITVVVEVIKRPEPMTEEKCVKADGEIWYDMNNNVVCQVKKDKRSENEHPINGTQPAAGKHQNRGSYVQGIRRAS